MSVGWGTDICFECSLSARRRSGVGAMVGLVARSLEEFLVH